MVRRLLRFIIIYAVIAAVACAVFTGVQKVMAGTYSPVASDEFKDGEEPLRIEALKDSYLGLFGRYTAGSNAGMLFCKIYDAQGNPVSRQDFYLSNTQLEIESVISAGDGVRIVCLCTPWDSSEGRFGAVFGIDGDWRLTETTFFKEPQETATAEGFDRFVCCDNSGAFFAGISGRTATLFSQDGRVKCSVSPDFFSSIRDVAVFGNNMLIGGTDTETSIGSSFRYGLCALYDIGGAEPVFRSQKTLMDSEGTCAAVMRTEIDDEGFIVSGRMMATGSDAWQSLNRIDRFRADDDPVRFHTAPDSADDNATSLFIVRLSPDGNITGSAVFYAGSNEHVPSISQYDPNSADNPLVFTTYYASEEHAAEYSINVMRMNRSLSENDSTVLQISGDTKILTSQDIMGKGLFMCVSLSGTGTYRILHFTSMEDAVNNMETILRVKPVRDYYFTLRKKAPVLFILAFALMLTVSGAGRTVRKRAKKK